MNEEKPVSMVIRERLEAEGRSYMANDNISDFIREGELDMIKEEVEEHIRSLLSSLVIDYKNDPNAIETAKRVSKMYVDEVFHGRYQPHPKIAEFPNVKGLDEVYAVGPITVRSTCSHHMVPILGEAWVGVIPCERVIGLSKFTRLIQWIVSRPQIQEESTVQIADKIEELIKPVGLAVVVRAKHMCMSWRGVKDNDTTMTTSVMRGIFRDDHRARNEFLSIIRGQEH